MCEDINIFIETAPEDPLSELKNMKTVTVPVDVVASYLGLSAQLIRDQARKDASLLGFPVVCAGSRVVAPRKPFIDFLEGRKAI